MSISIKDIARIAGVSHSTVSRALRDNSLIPLRTRERIQKIASEQGYTASAIARSLVTRKTNAVGVVVTSIADPFNGEIVDGLEQAANTAGYSVVLATSRADPERELSIVQSFRQRRVDGIVVASSRVGALYCEHASVIDGPVVLLNNQSAHFGHSISIDNVHGAREATEHLVGLGHRRIAYIGDRLGMRSDKERLKGYKSALGRHGIPIDNTLIVSANGTPESGRTSAAGLFSIRNPPSAIFCYNDMTALGVLDEAAERRIQVPRDLSVCGFDDVFFTSLVSPRLTTVRQPKYDLGQGAMKMLLELLSGNHSIVNVKVKGQLIVRASTAVPRS